MAAPPRSIPHLDPAANIPQEEERVLAFWKEERIFDRSISDRDEADPFVFYEGPPTTNGRPGVHHVLSRTCKDLVCRFWTMEGKQVKRKGGWDTHGLPVEIEVEKELGIEGKDQIERYGVAAFNDRCRQSVFRYKDEWENLTERIGFWLDLEHPYVTLDNDYIETVWWVFKRFWDDGLCYSGFKVLPYCPRCQTSLSDHEVSMGYKTVKDPAVTVKFPLVDEPDTFVLAWTTTPWTLPGNVALAVGPDIEYVKARFHDAASGKTEFAYFAKERAEAVLSGWKAETRPKKGTPEPEIVATFQGRDLVGKRYRPLFEGLDLGALTGKNAYYVAAGDFVNTDEGTGVVHTAVMYGADDYALGQAIDLPRRHTVDETGHFTEDVPRFAGRRVREVDPEIIQFLDETGLLFSREDHEHSYPFCWRCDTALLYYARSSWYLRTTAYKDRMLAENAKIRWFPPEVGENRFGDWLENNVDWAISRDRYWGTPLPIWTCEACKETVCIGSRRDIEERGGQVPEDLHRPHVDAVTWPCARCRGAMRRVASVLDVWFDSGAMPYAEWHYPFENEQAFERAFPADFICEGIDQSRGWFYSLLAIGTHVRGRAPYRTVLANGLLLDDQGRKMSKRLGNAVDPWDIVNEIGADGLRWYLIAASPPWTTTRFSRDGARETARKFFGTLRNVAAFFATYANADGWIPPGRPPSLSERQVLDRWLLSRLDAVSVSVREDLREYRMTRAARTLSVFVQDELSNWYVRRNRRRFWKGERGPDKEAAYATLHEALAVLSRLIAPIAPFLAETLHRALVVPFDAEAPASVHLARFPAPGESRRDPSLEEAMTRGQRITELARAARTQASLKVRLPLPRLLILGGSEAALLPDVAAIVQDEINVRSIVAANPEDALDSRLKPNFKALGPRFGSEAGRVAAAIKSLDPDSVSRGLPGGSWEVRPEGMEPVNVAGEEVLVEQVPRDGFVIVEDGALRVALDTRADASLAREGLVRELVHRLQSLRKEEGLAITDRIALRIGARGVLREALEEHREFVASELLADALTTGDPDSEHASWEVEGEAVTVRLEKRDVGSGSGRTRP